MQQTDIALPARKHSRAIPTRSAAIALLSLDAILLLAPLVLRWESWFVWAYIPLLFTVACGATLGGVWKRPAIALCSVPLLVRVCVGVAILFPGQNPDRLLYALVAGEVLLGCLGVAVVVLAVRGWVMFFRGGHVE